MTDTVFIADYFSAEKIHALLFMLVGMVAVALAAWMVKDRKPLRGMAIPVVAVALIQLTVGSVVYSRSDLQSTQLQQLVR